MLVQYGGKSHREAVWYTQALRLKIHDSNLTCRVANKCQNIRGLVEMVEWNKKKH